MKEIRDAALFHKVLEYIGRNGHTLSENYEIRIVEDMQPNIAIISSPYMARVPKYEQGKFLPELWKFEHKQREDVLYIVIGKRMSYGYVNIRGEITLMPYGAVKAVPTKYLLENFPNLSS